MNKETDIENSVLKKFMSLPEEKQKQLVDSMTKLFQKLEKEWKEDPKNKGKIFSYTGMWEDHCEKIRQTNPEIE